MQCQESASSAIEHQVGVEKFYEVMQEMLRLRTVLVMAMFGEDLLEHMGKCNCKRKGRERVRPHSELDEIMLQAQ